MSITRRSFLGKVAAGAACAAAAKTRAAATAPPPAKPPTEVDRRAHQYKYRVAFNCWMNDVRCEPLPLQNWPAPQLDDETMRSLLRAMDVQSAAGLEYLDSWGYFATTGYPPDIVSTFKNPDRRQKVQAVLQAAKDRGMKHVFGLGTYSWGYEEIIKRDPSVAGRNVDGSISTCVLCDADPRSFDYIKKILDCALSEYDFAGVHLESCDLGCCRCPKCAGKNDVVGYNVRINMKTADYIRGNWPDKLVYVIPINWIPWGHFDEGQKTQLIELSKHIDCFMDQGWLGTFIAPSERPGFIKSLHCAYGTSGGLWLYPSVRWDRASYFLPYTERNGAAIKRHFDEGARACMLYQGPMSNAGTEVNVAVAGRILADTRRSVEDALAEVIDLYYKPRSTAVQKRLVDIFQRAEEAYFGQWEPKAITAHYGPPGAAVPRQLVCGDSHCPGEFKLDDLWGDSPGPALYLKPPHLSEAGRKAYAKGLISILKDLPEVEGKADDHGRIANIKRSIIVTLTMVNSIG